MLNTKLYKTKSFLPAPLPATSLVWLSCITVQSSAETGFALDTRFPYGSWELRHLPSRGCPRDQPPSTPLALSFYRKSLVISIPQVWSQLAPGELGRVLCGSGRGALEPVPGFPQPQPAHLLLAQAFLPPSTVMVTATRTTCQVLGGFGGLSAGVSWGQGRRPDSNRVSPHPPRPSEGPPAITGGTGWVGMHLPQAPKLIAS